MFIGCVLDIPVIPVHSGRRPAVVIQNDLLNRSNINTTIVSLITSNLKLAGVPGNILVKKGIANLPEIQCCCGQSNSDCG